MVGHSSMELRAFALGALTATVIGYAFNRKWSKLDNSSLHSSSSSPSTFSTSSTSSTPTPTPVSNFPESSSNPKPLSDEFREEQLSRNTLFFGEEGMKDIRNR